MPIVDVTEVGGSLSIILPKLAGDLAHAIQGKGLTNKQKVRIAAVSLNALAFLHANGVMHRDIKPDNLLLTAEGDPVLADFSLGKSVRADGDEPVEARGRSTKRGTKKRRHIEDEDEGRQHTAGAGTPTYTAPEVVSGEEAYGVKADVWSLGVVLYEMFTGEALPVYKDKRAFALIEQAKAKMSDKPIPALLKRMLEVSSQSNPAQPHPKPPHAHSVCLPSRPTNVWQSSALSLHLHRLDDRCTRFAQVDPEKRLSAEEALTAIPGVKLEDLPQPTGAVLRLTPQAPPSAANHSKRMTKAKATLTAERICSMLGAANPTTAFAAGHYWRACGALWEHIEPATNGMAACALLAFKMNEVEVRACCHSYFIIRLRCWSCQLSVPRSSVRATQS